MSHHVTGSPSVGHHVTGSPKKTMKVNRYSAWKSSKKSNRKETWKRGFITRIGFLWAFRLTKTRVRSQKMSKFRKLLGKGPLSTNQDTKKQSSQSRVLLKTEFIRFITSESLLSFASTNFIVINCKLIVKVDELVVPLHVLVSRIRSYCLEFIKGLEDFSAKNDLKRLISLFRLLRNNFVIHKLSKNNI